MSEGVEYNVLRYTSFRELNEYVNKALAAGWTCQGGVGSYTAASTVYVMQAMIKIPKPSTEAQL